MSCGEDGRLRLQIAQCKLVDQCQTLLPPGAAVTSPAAAPQVTTEEDLEIIFSRFGTITSCDIIRDFKTGAADDLQLRIADLLWTRKRRDDTRI